jgi:hypothetical protein
LILSSLGVFSGSFAARLFFGFTRQLAPDGSVNHLFEIAACFALEAVVIVYVKVIQRPAP